MPTSGGETQVRFMRPRPSVCCPAATTVPSGAPAFSSARADLNVESTTLSHTMFRPSQRVCRLASTASARSGSPVSQ